MVFKNPWGENQESDQSFFCNIKVEKSGTDFFKKKFFIFNKDKGLKALVLKLLLGFVFIWLVSGFYIVQQEETAVILRFGKYIREETAGLHYHLPMPIERAFIDTTTRIKTLQVGDKNLVGSFFMYKTIHKDKENQNRLADSLMLTSDENIIDATFEVQWKIKSLRDFIFNVRNRNITIHSAAQSAIREIISMNNLSDILTSGRAKIEEDSKSLLQEILDSYDSGVDIVLVQMLRVDPPSQVINAFRDVQTARVNKESMINQAKAYENDVIPSAKGQAGKIIQDAEAYAESEINKAKGNADRFNKVYEQYRLAPYVTRKRIYLDTMEEIFKKNDVTIIDSSAKNIILSVNSDEKVVVSEEK